MLYAYLLCWALLGVWLPLAGRAQSVSAQGPAASSATDTLKLTLPEAEKLFLDRNLQLLAQRLNISAVQAQVLQARLWANPVLTYEMNVYNPAYKTWFRTGNLNEKTDPANPTGPATGTVQFQLDQLFATAGKRSKLVATQRTNVEIAEYVFNDLLRALKLTLRTDFYQLNEYYSSKAVFEKEAKSLDVLVRTLQVQVTKGNIARKELVRLQALQFSLQAGLKDLNNQLYSIEAELRTLLRLPIATTLVPLMTPADTLNPALPPLDSLTTNALEYRADLKAATAQAKLANQTLTYQRSLAVPDVDVHVIYDRLNSFVKNYTGVGVAVGLPSWNRNQGNIQSARVNIQVAEANLEASQQQVINQVMAAYQQLLQVRETASKFEVPFSAQFDEFFELLIQTYENKNITLLEFIDFFESYRDTKLRTFQLNRELQAGRENLNYTVGRDIVR